MPPSAGRLARRHRACLISAAARRGERDQPRVVAARMDGQGNARRLASGAFVAFGGTGTGARRLGRRPEPVRGGERHAVRTGAISADPGDGQETGGAAKREVSTTGLISSGSASRWNKPGLRSRDHDGRRGSVVGAKMTAAIDEKDARCVLGSVASMPRKCGLWKVHPKAGGHRSCAWSQPELAVPLRCCPTGDGGVAFECFDDPPSVTFRGFACWLIEAQPDGAIFACDHADGEDVAATDHHIPRRPPCRAPRRGGVATGCGGRAGGPQRSGRGERSRAEQDAAANPNARPRPTEAATVSHAADQARLRAAGKIHADYPDADRAAVRPHADAARTVVVRVPVPVTTPPCVMYRPECLRQDGRGK